jgi:hypothetical protein
MIPKSGRRFSEKDHAPNKKQERDDISKKGRRDLTGGLDALSELR